MDDCTLPSTSKDKEEPIGVHIDELMLNIKNEESEIAQLELPERTDEDKKVVSHDEDRYPNIEFLCKNCDMHEMVHYYGKEPPFAYGIKFLEDTYVLHDPFQAPPPRWKAKAEYFVALGAECSKCQRTVCRDAKCSIFYTTTFCLDCAAKMGSSFPSEVTSKVTKQFKAKKSA